MRKPKAQILNAQTPNEQEKAAQTKPKSNTNRPPKAFASKQAKIQTLNFEPAEAIAPAPGRTKGKNWMLRLAFGAGALLLSLGLTLAADQLLRDLFARYDWLGWVGIAALAIFVLAIAVLVIREILALKSLKNLDDLRERSVHALHSDLQKDAQPILHKLNQLYHSRPELAKARQQLDKDLVDQIDGAPMVQAAEHRLMGQLDAQAKTLTAAAARRVAIVTAISPRALVDVAFVAYESMKLARAIAQLYGARPGLFGTWRLAREILAHLAITGGVALGDSVVQQLLGHGLAAKLSARLGEGLVNGLMSVRVGIAAMRVTRPLPYNRLKQPKVVDFMADLANITKTEPDEK